MEFLQKSQSKGDKVFDIINYIFITLFLLVVLYPIIYLVSASISSPEAVNSGAMWLFPKDVTFKGYQAVFQNKQIWTGYWNSAVYTVLGTMLSVSLTIITAYGLSRPKVPGKGIITFYFTFTMFFSGGLVPSYLLIESLGLYNSIWAILLPGCLGMWNIIIARTYIQTSIPEELIEAASIDGCSHFRIFTQIILPLSKPIIIVVALFYGVGMWNSWFNALMYLSDNSKYPLQLFLREILILNEAVDTSSIVDSQTIVEQMQVANLIKYAVIMVASLPTIIIYPFLQKHFEKGMTVGSIKG